jgi:uncharacterized protein
LENRRNPFEYGRELASGELIDRQGEKKEIEATIRNRGKMFIIGPRRYGKTSLLSAVAEEVASRGVIVLRFDAEKYETLERLAEALLGAAARALKSPLERAIELIQKVAVGLRPQFTIDPEGRPILALGSGADPHSLPLLTDTLDAIEALAQHTGSECVVMLDEIQQILVEHGIQAERQLRSTIQRHAHVGYVFAGSATRLLTEMTNEPNRPFYRLGSRLFLDAIPREDFRQALEERFSASGYVVEPGAAEHILDRAADVPYNVQRLAHEAWEMLRERGGGAVAPALVDEALERVVRREDTAYTQIWNSLRKNQRLALRAIIEEGGEALFRAEVARRARVTTSSLQAAIAQLEHLDLVRRVSSAGRTRWTLVDPFLAAWLRMAQSI